MARPRKYDDAFRERAIRLVVESGRPVAHVAGDLGMNPESLRKWVRQAEVDGRPATGSGPLMSAERDRLLELERENKELRQANEILKAASIFFARELDRPPPGPKR